MRQELGVFEKSAVRAPEPDRTGGEERVARLVALRKALSDPIRLRMLGMLAAAMAEVILRHLAGNRFEASSAGTEATYVRPLAVRAMDEIGVDISAQESKELQRYQWESFEYVVTVCDEANEACPVFPWAKNRLQLVLREPIVGHRQRRGASGDVSEGAGPNQGVHRERARAD